MTKRPPWCTCAHLLVVAVFAVGLRTASAAGSDAGATASIAMPGGAGGIGFDDLVFAPRLHEVLAPGGATGVLALVDTASHGVVGVGSFSASHAPYQGGHDEGTTSADEGAGWLFVIDRTTRMLHVVAPARGAIVASAPLAAGPDYVRWVEPTHEVWVSEPSAEQIEVFALPSSGKPLPSSVARVAVRGGPESLVIDRTRKRAFTHLWHGSTVAVDLAARAVVATWPNGCGGSRGIALDDRRGFLFAGCSEGKATVLDVDHGGKLLGSATCGAGVDVIAYSPELAHLYVPGASAATMAVFAVGAGGSPSLLETVPTAPGAHCVAADDRRQAWVCDPHHGRLLLYEDRHPASGR